MLRLVREMQTISPVALVHTVSMLEGYHKESIQSTGTTTDPGYTQRKVAYNDDTKAVNNFTVAVPLKGIFGFCDHDKVLYGLKIRFQLQRNDNENRYSTSSNKMILTCGHFFARVNHLITQAWPNTWPQRKLHIR